MSRKICVGDEGSRPLELRHAEEEQVDEVLDLDDLLRRLAELERKVASHERHLRNLSEMKP